jgi:hypothetical protein
MNNNALTQDTMAAVDTHLEAARRRVADARNGAARATLELADAIAALDAAVDRVLTRLQRAETLRDLYARAAEPGPEA